MQADHIICTFSQKKLKESCSYNLNKVSSNLFENVLSDLAGDTEMEMWG
jgi:archaellum biogenesis ATPase FlaH